MKTLKEFANENLNAKELLTTEELSGIKGGFPIAICVLGNCTLGSCSLGECILGRCTASSAF